jgi:glyoxylase-like metal-dependent hydrolase (beta-lactamase superfamily II)
MEVRRLYLGTIDTPMNPTMPFHTYVIDHPDGLTLVDTGFGTTLALMGARPSDPSAMAGVAVLGEQEAEMYWTRRTTLEGLADHNIEPGDVKYVINTHIGDHSGDNHMFPEATFLLQEREVEWVRANQPHGPASIQEWDFPGAKIELLHGEDQEVLPGLKCIFTPGHTPGHQSVFLEADGKKILVCGDAAYSQDIWDNPEQMVAGHEMYEFQNQLGDEGLEIWRDSIRRLKELDADVVHFAHDTQIIHAR